MPFYNYFINFLFLLNRMARGKPYNVKASLFNKAFTYGFLPYLIYPKIKVIILKNLFITFII